MYDNAPLLTVKALLYVIKLSIKVSRPKIFTIHRRLFSGGMVYLTFLPPNINLKP